MPIDETGRDADDTLIGETELAGQRMGHNKLQGDDQLNVHNERQAAPDTKLEPDADPVHSAELLDKDVRAEAELGKGNRHDPSHPSNQPSDEATGDDADSAGTGTR